MVSVKVTVAVGSRKVAAEAVRDARTKEMLLGAGREVAQKLTDVVCPVHGQPPKDVRVHFDKDGAADLKMDSCCDELGKKVTAALG